MVYTPRPSKIRLEYTENMSGNLQPFAQFPTREDNTVGVRTQQKPALRGRMFRCDCHTCAYYIT
jgi:hypothetical protein